MERQVLYIGKVQPEGMSYAVLCKREDRKNPAKQQVLSFETARGLIRALSIKGLPDVEIEDGVEKPKTNWLRGEPARDKSQEDFIHGFRNLYNEVFYSKAQTESAGIGA